jgi:hypothetical protein
MDGPVSNYGSTNMKYGVFNTGGRLPAEAKTEPMQADGDSRKPRAASS